jgi:transposase InsO family protein
MSGCDRRELFFVPLIMTERRKTRRDTARLEYAKKQELKAAESKGDVKAAPPRNLPPTPAVPKKLDLSYDTKRAILEVKEPGKPAHAAVGIDAKQYLRDLADELHKPVRVKHPTRKVFVEGKDHTWGMDLGEMGHWAEENKGMNYILTCIDIFTRYGFARAIKTKGADDVLEALKDIVKESGRQPKWLWVDQGKEFVNQKMEKWRDEHNIGLYHVFGRGKSAICERFNKTLKGIMFKELTATNSLKWVAILPELVARYNSNVHGTLKMTPAEASAHPEKALKRWYEIVKGIPPPGKAKFKVGDWVRVSKEKGVFNKGYLPGWTREIFRVVGIIEKTPLTYRLVDYWGESITGGFYTEQIQKVKHPDVWLVNQILEDKGKGKARKLFVSWVGYPKEFNSWIDYASTQKV